MAYNDLIGKYGWDAVTILYENNESMSRLKEVLDRTAKVSDFHTIMNHMTTEYLLYKLIKLELAFIKICILKYLL